MAKESEEMMKEFIEVCGTETEWPHRSDWSWSNALAAFKGGWEAGKSFQQNVQRTAVKRVKKSEEPGEWVRFANYIAKSRRR
jgi:hypothetical protein